MNVRSLIDALEHGAVVLSAPDTEHVTVRQPDGKKETLEGSFRDIYWIERYEPAASAGDGEWWEEQCLPSTGSSLDELIERARYRVHANNMRYRVVRERVVIEPVWDSGE